RRKEMFISGGENVFPVEIEAALYDHPAVAECAVLGVPDDRWGEVGLAVVVPRQGAIIDPDALAAFLRARVARYKVPKHMVFVAELPKSGAGKILKPELLRRFLAQDLAGGNQPRPRAPDRPPRSCPRPAPSRGRPTTAAGVGAECAARCATRC